MKSLKIKYLFALLYKNLQVEFTYNMYKYN